MVNVQLVPHCDDYCERIYDLSSDPPVKDALGLPDGTIESTKQFIESMIIEEAEGKTVSRVILDENNKVVGITTLMFIDHVTKSCHIGSWIGHQYWGRGYNLDSKIAILRIAFNELNLNYVFAGARKSNIRSQKAQEKLPFIRLNVENKFPIEHGKLEYKERQPCVLNAFYREDFVHFLNGEAGRNCNVEVE